MAFSSLEIGKSALLAANYGLQVTGQNMSNVNTTGYSRQVVTQTAVTTVNTGRHILGSGVSVVSVSSLADAYANKQLRTATSSNSYACDINSYYTTLQNTFSELTGTALSDDLNNFWNSMSDLAGHVESLSNRSTVLEDAKALTEHFNTIASSLNEQRAAANKAVEDAVATINDLAATIASLNKSIVAAESAGLSSTTAADLRDSRTEALRQLSELTNIEVTDEKNGSCIVSVNGRSLVYFDQHYEVAVEYERSDGLMAATPVFSRDGHPLNSSEGTIAAQTEIRDTIIPGYIDEVDSLAAAFTWEFNRAYSEMRGSEPFDSLTSLYSPVDPSVTLDKLAIKTDTADGTFQIVNGTLVLVVYNANTGQETSVSVDIDLDGRDSPSGEPDMILWDPANPDASNSLINRLQSALDDAVPGAFRVSVDNEYKVTIESLSDDYGFSFESDTSGVLAVLGMNVFFTGHTAADIGVNGILTANPQYMCVATSSAGGDNSGLQSLQGFRDTGIDRLGGQTPDEYYQTLVGRLGSEASSAATRKSLKADILLQSFNQRESISGINEDEEALNLITYQRAYQSAAHYISVVDEIYDTLINM
ncbi:MAG: flagellar hook-associated protein FlgK [Planctomycetes bacterium]|nr:flagellar hook-associated protein FlgK [Planctomycetota bacterium]